MSALVVIIDDDVDLLFLLTRHLEKLGATTCGFSTLSEGLRFLEAERESVSALCVDLSLPDGNGFELCASLKWLPGLSHVPVLLMSGRTGLDEEARAMEVGAVAFLKKPFRTKVFLERLTPLLDKQRAPVPEVNG